MMTPYDARAPTRQSLVIEAWHPHTNVNGSNARRHWSVIRKNHDIDRDTAWASAKQAGWVFMSGKVRLTITLVYPRKYRVDADNLAARCKGVIDGLKELSMPYIHTGLPNCCKRWCNDRSCHRLERGPERILERLGFFLDDDTEHLDLVVRAEIVPGQKATRIELEALT